MIGTSRTSDSLSIRSVPKLESDHSRCTTEVGKLDRGGWRLFISLHLHLDIAWWSQWSVWRSHAQNKRGDTDFARQGLGCPSAMLLLSESMPLGWAVMLRDHFASDSRMDKWSVGQWIQYLNTQLHPLLNKEANAMKSVSNPIFHNLSIPPWQSERPVWLWSYSQGLTKQGSEYVTQSNMEQMEGGVLFSKDGGLNVEVASKIESSAAKLSALLAGRSLLQQEVDLLLKEHEYAMPETFAWRQALQLAYLQGRVALTSAVAMGHSRRREASDGTELAHRKLHWFRLATAIPRAVARRKEGARCRRCGSEVQTCTPCGSCGSLCCAYCEACLTLGRSKLCALLVQGSAVRHEDVPPSLWRHIPRDESEMLLSASRWHRRWRWHTPSDADEPAMHGSSGSHPHSVSDMGGRGVPVPTSVLLDRWGLSPAQRAAAGAALDFLQGAPSAGRSGSFLPKSTVTQQSNRLRQAPNRFLLWAVTGAGKTEMIFPLLASVLERGGKALVATPRRDVVLELSPRLKVAFPDVKLSTLYGGSSDRFKQGDLVVATTHQLMRFAYCFDVVVIDELDAFPYHNDPMLAYAAEQCCKPDGKFILLSATPPALLQREVARGTLPHAKVPARFHGHPLPVPKYIRMNGVENALRTKKLPVGLIASLRISVQRGAQIFVFVSRIRHIAPLITVLRRYFLTLPIDGTSSEDSERAEKVMRFRACEIRMLVTTTILERGVTVKKSDVYILDADSDLFDEASLVQMAGRAGRSSDDPAGLVVFSALDWTKYQRKAIAQIKQMNALARKRGYLK